MATKYLRPRLYLAMLGATLICPAALAQTSGSAGGDKPDQNAPQHFDSQSGKQDGQSLSQRLERSNGVIRPPEHVDPEMHQPPPPSSDRMPVVPPPGSPGGDQSVKPK